MYLPKIKVSQKTGEEHFSYNGNPTGHALVNFWQWGMSNIISNTERGALAEYIVASAIGVDSEIRNDWEEYDLTSHDGRIKIEVKSASFIQVWEQKELSKISFGTRAQKATEVRCADLYVFCLLKHKDQETIDPLKLEQWQFYVVPTKILNSYERSKSSITLPSLEKLASPVSYENLRSSILNADI